MEILLIVSIFLILFLLLSLIALNTDFMALKTKFFERNVNDLLNRANTRKSHGKLISYIEQLITKSNIKFVWRSYGVFFHLTISIFFFVGFYISDFLSAHYLVKVCFGLIGFFIPSIVLKLLGYQMENKVRKSSIVYVSGVRNYNRTFNDIFKAFEMVIESTPEPLKSYTRSMVLKHKAKVSQAKCLNDFQTNVGIHSELGLFIDNLKLAIYEGADINRLLEEYIRDMEKLYELEDEFLAEEVTARVAIYLLIAIVILGTRAIYTISYTNSVVNEVWHQLAVSLSLIASLFIIIRTLRR